MEDNIFSYQKPQNTYTLDQFIACQSDTVICYNNLSFTDQYDNIKFNVYNVLNDYIDEIKENYCLLISLDKDQFNKYKYNPKILCYDVYGVEEIAFIILLINDICSIKDFTKNKLYMPTEDGLKLIEKYMYNANKDAISIYNEKNKK